MEAKNISLCLISKDPVYPPEILNHVQQFGFGEILILCNSDSPFRKHELFAKAKHDFLAYQDDDAICPWKELLEQAEPDKITLAIKPAHFEAHKNNRATMGIGWGAILPKSTLSVLNLYKNIYGEDAVYKRETERILTYLSFPQKRLILPIQDLESAYNMTRLWRQPEHGIFKSLAEERCERITNGPTE